MAQDDLASRLITAEAKKHEAWLRGQFAKAAVLEPVDPQHVKVRLPNVFLAEVVSETRSGRQEACIYPIEVVSGVADDALEQIYEQIIMAGVPWIGKPLYEYVPQDQIFEIGKAYKVIEHMDPEHDHNSPRLINLLPLESHGRSLHKGSLATGEHCHLLIR